MAVVHAQLKIRNTPFCLTTHDTVVRLLRRAAKGLGILDYSRRKEKLVVVSVLLHPLALAGPPNMFFNRMDPTDMEY